METLKLPPTSSFYTFHSFNKDRLIEISSWKVNILLNSNITGK